MVLLVLILAINVVVCLAFLADEEYFLALLSLVFGVVIGAGLLLVSESKH